MVGAVLLRVARVDVDRGTGPTPARVCVTAGAGPARASTRRMLPVGERASRLGPDTTDLCLALDRHPHASSSDLGVGDTDDNEAPAAVRSLAEQRRAALIEAPVDDDVTLWLHDRVVHTLADPTTASPPPPSGALAKARVPIQRLIREATGVAERLRAPFLDPASGFSGTVTLDVVYLPAVSWEMLTVQRRATAAAGAEAAPGRTAGLRRRLAALSPGSRPPAAPSPATPAAGGATTPAAAAATPGRSPAPAPSSLSPLPPVHDLVTSYAGVLVVHVHSASAVPVADILTGLADP